MQSFPGNSEAAVSAITCTTITMALVIITVNLHGGFPWNQAPSEVLSTPVMNLQSWRVRRVPSPTSAYSRETEADLKLHHLNWRPWHLNWAQK